MDYQPRNTRPPSFESDNERPTFSRIPPASVALGHRSTRRKGTGQHVHPNPPLTPTAAPPPTMPQAISNPLLPSAPASPPTPAPSPTPHGRSAQWHDAHPDIEDPTLRDARLIFSRLDLASKEAWLTALVDVCDHQALGFLHRLVSPRLKKDPFKVLPDELCLRVKPPSILPPSSQSISHSTDLALNRSSSMSTIRKPSYELPLSRNAGENL